MSSLQIVVMGDLHEPSLARLRERHRVYNVGSNGEVAAAEANVPASAEVVILRSPFCLSHQTVDRCAQLRAVIRAGTGTDNLDMACLHRRAIAFHTVPASAPAVAELAIGLLIALARGIPRWSAAVAGGDWPKWDAVGFELQGKTLGILGYGRIGKRVAALGRALGMSVVAHNGRRTPLDAEDAIVAFDELLMMSELLVLCAPLNSTSRGVVDRRALHQLPPGAVLVNVARGELVDTDSLLGMLDSGHLAGAGLDTVAGEPAIPERLRRHPKVLLTPHIGAQTIETRRRIGLRVEEIVESLSSGVDTARLDERPLLLADGLSTLRQNPETRVG